VLTRFLWLAEKSQATGRINYSSLIWASTALLFL
jgi:hypothetical protein